MKILTAAQMGEVDRLTTELYNVPSLLLMENAGRSVADELEKSSPSVCQRRVVILCGKGNNGGDGLVVARHLSLRGGRPQVLLFSDPAQLRGDALANWDMVRTLGLDVRVLAAPIEIRKFLKGLETPDVVVDALFGTGLSKPAGAEFRTVIDWINRCAAKALVVSVDIPSGLFADSPLIPGPAVKAHLTVTFTALKLAHVMPPASDCAGRVVVVPIGSPPALIENSEYRTDTIDDQIVRQALPPRRRDSHKGSYGHVFVLAGSRGKSGAALMTGLAALRSGAGLVTLWLPESLQKDVVGKVPELMTESLPETAAGTFSEAGFTRLISRLKDADVLIVGPGLTTSHPTRELVHQLVRHSTVPLVVDADGLNAFAPRPGDLRNQEGRPVIVTPHPGEMARLIGRTISEVQSRRLETARACCADYGWFTVLKGYQTIVASPEGRIFINSTGNPGMASGGSGDILAGMVGCLAARWNRKYHGADLGKLVIYLSAAVFLHGLAGDLAAAEKGMESMMATDLLPHLPDAFKSVLEGRGRSSARPEGKELNLTRD